MSIFQKLFGRSSKEAPESKTDKWDVVLSECDLLMARDEIADMHKMLNKKGEKDGGAYYFKKEYVSAWEAFRDRPNNDTARMLLDVAPQLLKYFEMCSPGSSLYLSNRFLKKRGL